MRDGGPSAEEMGLSSQETESNTEKELNDYVDEMKEALSDMMVYVAAKGIPSTDRYKQHNQFNLDKDVRIAFKAALKINGSIELVLGDTNRNLDIEVVQKNMDQSIADLGLEDLPIALDKKKFSLSKLQELTKKLDLELDKKLV